MTRQWTRELLMGARFAVTGGRAGWTSTLLTALGVGFGVAVLLLAASIPSAMSGGEVRQEQRQPSYVDEGDPQSDTSILLVSMGTQFRDDHISGSVMQADGDPADAVHPPGIDRLPEQGEMYVSPALKKLLESADGKELLADRFKGSEIVGTIADEGLSGPAELLYYVGSDGLSKSVDSSSRVDGFGDSVAEEEALNPTLLMLVIVMVVVLLMPIAVFIATAVRFGGEGRDRRLAALRLVGADNAMTRRIAAGESLTGALFGLLLGAWFFLLARSFAGDVTLFELSAYPRDVTPGLGLALLIVLLVPICAVAVTLFALRKVAISPLGVVREGADRGRRLVWRLALLVLGVGILLLIGPGQAEASTTHTWLLAGSVVLTLVGLTTLLPWAVERVVDKLRGGPLSWQLASRRLQLNSGLAARSVSGVTIAVAGAVALQMLFGAVEADDRVDTGQDPNRAQLYVGDSLERGETAEDYFKAYEQVEGVNEVLGYVNAYVMHERAKPNQEGWRLSQSLVIADCATIKEFIKADSCREGDSFFVPSAEEGGEEIPPKPGDRYDLSSDAEWEESKDPKWWTVPEGLRKTTAIDNPVDDDVTTGLFVTPSLLDTSELENGMAMTLMRTTDDTDVVERARNVTGVHELGGDVSTLAYTSNSDEFNSIKNGLLLGAVIIMLLIAGSMIVSTIEQLRERKRQLSVLVAFGTRRSTLGASVLWQTAIPVLLGLTVAGAGGVGLGMLLLNMIDGSVTDWLALLPLLGAGLGMIALVTLASMPSLWRMMRPDGLRTE